MAVNVIDETQGEPSNASQWELDIDTLLDNFQMILTGKYAAADGKGNVIIKREEKYALVNEQGSRYIVSRISLVVNRWTALTLCDQAQIMKFVLYESDAIRMELRAKKKEFGIARHNFESLVLAVAEFMYLSLSKSIKEGERTYRRGVERRIFSLPGNKGVTETVKSLFQKSSGTSS